MAEESKKIFDFQSVSIDPNSVLRSVSSQILNLHRSAVSPLATRFYESTILSKNEWSDCETARTLLDLLGRKSTAQIELAINIICEDKANQSIIDTIKNKYPTACIDTLNQTPASSVPQNMTQNALLSRAEKQEIVSALMQDPTIFQRWGELADQLEISGHVVAQLRTDLLVHTKSPHDVITDIVNHWATNKGVSATIREFCRILEKLEMNSTRHLLQPSIR